MSKQSRGTAKTLSDIIQLDELIHVVDIGANPIDGAPPYQPLLARKLCYVTGFEPLEEARNALRSQDPSGNYLSNAVGDGAQHTLRVCRAEGMTSLLKPHRKNLSYLTDFETFGSVVQEKSISTSTLDDIQEVKAVDYVKIDTQGSELTIIQGGKEKIKNCVVIQIEVSFFALYEDQPNFSAIDNALSSLGFMLHKIEAIKRWPISPYRSPAANQVLEGDFVYVKDFRQDASFSLGQWLKMAYILHYCYKSYDLAAFCLRRIMETGNLSSDRCAAYDSLVRSIDKKIITR
jgi:FkbM family methyltransferase